MTVNGQSRVYSHCCTALKTDIHTYSNFRFPLIVAGFVGCTLLRQLMQQRLHLDHVQASYMCFLLLLLTGLSTRAVPGSGVGWGCSCLQESSQKQAVPLSHPPIPPHPLQPITWFHCKYGQQRSVLAMEAALRTDCDDQGQGRRLSNAIYQWLCSEAWMCVNQPWISCRHQGECALCTAVEGYWSQNDLTRVDSDNRKMENNSYGQLPVGLMSLLIPHALPSTISQVKRQGQSGQTGSD